VKALRRETRLYRYVHVSDDGMAPAIKDGQLTLATCKPVIRRGAGIGDWVMGFYPSPADPGVLGWAARISWTLHHPQYEEEFRGRPDAVYGSRDGAVVRLREDYHTDQRDMDKDLSAPVLLFDRSASWYFGDRPVPLPPHLMHLAPSGQGHRVNNRRPGDEAALLAWLLSQAPPGIIGRPRHEGVGQPSTPLLPTAPGRCSRRGC